MCFQYVPACLISLVCLCSFAILSLFMDFACLSVLLWAGHGVFVLCVYNVVMYIVFVGHLFFCCGVCFFVVFLLRLCWLILLLLYFPCVWVCAFGCVFVMLFVLMSVMVVMVRVYVFLLKNMC